MKIQWEKSEKTKRKKSEKEKWFNDLTEKEQIKKKGLKN